MPPGGLQLTTTDPTPQVVMVPLHKFLETTNCGAYADHLCWHGLVQPCPLCHPTKAITLQVGPTQPTPTTANKNEEANS